MTPAPDENTEVVYKRPQAAPDGATGDNSLRARTREIAPAITPLIFGFLVLLGLIFGLGWWSGRQMDFVTFQARDFEIQHSARLELLLNLRLSVTQLNNEARARHEA